MSLDRRIREELRRDATRIAVDVERNLGSVEGRTRHPAPSLLPLLISTLALTVVLVLRAVSTTPNVGPPGAASPTPSENAFATIAGVYRTTLDAADDPKVVGTWTMELRANGTVVLSPPTSFSGTSIQPSGISYSVEGDRFRTDMFYNDYCTSIGTYAWALRSDMLTLTPSTEGCALRRTLLATSAWTKLR